MTTVDVLERARAGFRGQAWREAYASFAAADQHGALEPEDLVRYARSAYLVGEDQHCVDLLERAFRGYLDQGEPERATESAFWLAFNLLNRGQMAQAGGWLARADQLVETLAPLCAVRGLLLVPVALQALMQGDVADALARFGEAEDIGRRCGDPDVLALGGLGLGQARLAQGEIDAAWRKLDEVMVGVTAGEVSPVVAGVVYCAVIVACHETYQMHRAAEWTRALARWCDAQPGLVPFRGQCLVHRAQILEFNGAWPEAMEQVHLAGRLLSHPPGQPAAGAALYEQAELYRLRGEYAAAEDAYRAAGQHGHETQPGLGLLRLAQGRCDAAERGVRRALDEPQQRGNRPRLLAAYVDIALSGRDVAAARHAADELSGLAVAADSTLLGAMSAHATGSVLLAEGEPRKALEDLRRACTAWRDLAAPYLCARTRLLVGRACRELGDDDTAEIEFDAAADVFRRLAAEPDLSAMTRSGTVGTGDAHGLTPRELEVLRALATGKSNKAIAEELFLSQKTVARHVTNVFTKLGVSSRSAATAHAWEHHLV